MLFKGDIKLQLLFHKFELGYMFLITETDLMTIIKKSCPTSVPFILAYCDGQIPKRTLVRRVFPQWRHANVF